MLLILRHGYTVFQPSAMHHVQVETLLNDLEEEIQTGQYINSLGQPQDAAILNTAHGQDDVWGTMSAPLTSGTLGPHSTSSYPSQPFARHVFDPLDTPGGDDAAPELQLRSGDAPPPAPVPSPATRIPGRPGNPRSGSGLAAAAYGAAATSILGPRARIRMTQPLARPHRAAVRAVLSMPCDTIPEDERAEFEPPPPFVSVHSPPPSRHVAGAADVGRQSAAGDGRADAAAVPGVKWAISSLFDQQPSTSSDGSDRPDSARGSSPVVSSPASAPPPAAADPASGASAVAESAQGGGLPPYAWPRDAHSTQHAAAARFMVEVAEPLVPWPTSDDALLASDPLRRLPVRTVGTSELVPNGHSAAHDAA